MEKWKWSIRTIWTPTSVTDSSAFIRHGSTEAVFGQFHSKFVAISNFPCQNLANTPTLLLTWIVLEYRVFLLWSEGTAVGLSETKYKTKSIQSVNHILRKEHCVNQSSVISPMENLIFGIVWFSQSQFNLVVYHWSLFYYANIKVNVTCTLPKLAALTGWESFSWQ